MTRPLSRRSALSMLGLGASSLIGGSAFAGSPQCLDVPAPPARIGGYKGPSLGRLARAKGIDFSIQADMVNQQDYGAGVYDPVYWQAILSEEPAYIAFGSAFKFGNIAADPPIGNRLSFTQTTYNIPDTWFLADFLGQQCRKAGLRARADALVWDSEQVRQPWLRSIPRGSSPDRTKNRDLDWNISRAEDYVRAAFAKMTALSSGKSDFFKIVVPVNEPLDIWAVPGKVAYRGGAFCPPGVVLDEHEGTLGYISDIYRLAGKLRGPKGPGRPSLIINEAGTEVDQGGDLFRTGLLTLLKRMLAEGVPIDGVGIESHLQPQMMTDPFKPDWGQFGAFLDEVADLGLDIHLTELDVLDYVTSCNGRPGRTEDSDKLVALYFEGFLTRALACKAVKSVTVWDLSDRYSFYRYLDVANWFGYDQLPKGRRPPDWPKCAKIPAGPAAVACPRPAVYDERYQPKLARAAIARAFERAPSRG